MEPDGDRQAVLLPPLLSFGGGTSGWVEVWKYWGGWVEEVLVVGAHHGGWKDARTIYAD